MLTEEQIKNLQPGDPLVIKGTYVMQSLCRNIVIECDMNTGCGRFADKKYFLPSCVSLPDNSQSKYDLTRLFKEGDKVKRRTVDGRTDPDVQEGINLAVTTDEDKYGNVRVQEPNGRSIVTKSVFLELVTPVEEIEPYTVWDTTFSFNVGVEDTKAVFYYGTDMSTCPYTKEQAKAAAEAERDRLNAEYRKKNQK